MRTFHIWHIGSFMGLLLMMPFSLSAQQRNPFRALAEENRSQQIRRTLSASDTISLEGQGIIYSLSIDATILQPKEASFARIVLEDKDGHDYLVAESDRFRNDTTEVHLDHYCEETALLEGITPRYLKCYLAEDASLLLSCIYLSGQPTTRQVGSQKEIVEDLKKAQIQDVVNRINSYNIKNKKLWRAGITVPSLLKYDNWSEKEVPQDAYSANVRYYASGIFEMGEQPSGTSLTENSNYIPNFDWRKRHGTNWITSIKNQGNSPYCTAFAICGMLEARCNLYFNQLLDLDLSEQDIVHNYYLRGYHYINNMPVEQIYTHGLDPSRALRCVMLDSLLDESSVPFVDSIISSIPPRPDGLERISISVTNSLGSISSHVEDVKDLLIHHGPIVSGIYNCGLNHAMTLVGYHTIQAGDTIHQVKIQSEGGLFSYIIIPPDSPFIGETYWIFKDSYGADASGRIDGYFNIWFKTYSCMRPIVYTESAISRRDHSNSEIRYEDLDGDGYFNWGIGPKPTHCPTWVPNEPDGDDSDATIGPMDEYGYCANISPDSTIYIDVNTEYPSGLLHISNNICIRNSSTLTLSCDLLMNRLAEIRIKPSSTLIVNGTIHNANIKPEPGSTLILNNGGKIITHRSDDFVLPTGAKLQINNGTIE